MKQIIVIAALVLSSLSGCVSMTPALGGKTKYKMSFEDNLDSTTDPVTGAITAPGQRTKFEVDITAAAGSDIKNLASMDYEWEEGTGKISVAGDTKLDTTLQAEALVAVNQAQMEAATNMLTAVTNVLTALGPVIAPILAQNAAVSGGPAVLPDASSPPTAPGFLLDLLRQNPQWLDLLKLPK